MIARGQTLRSQQTPTQQAVPGVPSRCLPCALALALTAVATPAPRKILDGSLRDHPSFWPFPKSPVEG